MDKEIDNFDTSIFPDNIRPVIEELYWLSQNEAFQKDAARFRQKWCIFEDKELRGLKETRDVQEIKGRGKDFQKIFSRCRLHNTRDAVEFQPVLYHYLTTDELKNYYDRSPRGLPPVTIKLTSDRKAFTIKGALPIDVTKEEFKTLADLLFEDVKEQQRKLGVRRLKGSEEDSFILSARVWHIYRGLARVDSSIPKNKVYDYLDEDDLRGLRTEGETGNEVFAVVQRVNEAEKRVERSYS